MEIFSIIMNINLREINKHQGDSRVSSWIRTILSAVLIAMSPFNDVDAQNVIKENIAKGRKAQLMDGSFAKYFEYEDVNVVVGHPKCEICFFSKDGDDIPETATIKYNIFATRHIMIDGKRTPVMTKTRHIIKVKGLRIVNVTDTLLNGEVTHYKQYRVVGHEFIYRWSVDKDNWEKNVNCLFKKERENSETEIFDDFYYRLSATMGDNLEYLPTIDKKTRRLGSFYDYDLY